MRDRFKWIQLFRFRKMFISLLIGFHLLERAVYIETDRSFTHRFMVPNARNSQGWTDQHQESGTLTRSPSGSPTWIMGLVTLESFPVASHDTLSGSSIRSGTLGNSTGTPSWDAYVSRGGPKRLP